MSMLTTSLLLLLRATNRHMIRHKYVPFDLGRKTVYGRK